MAEPKLRLDRCLFFTAGALARHMSAMADDCFKPVGLTPSQGFALLCIVEEPGISASELAEELQLAPSTITRVVETLVRQELVNVTQEGRWVTAKPTPKGHRRSKKAHEAWRLLYRRYVAALGKTKSADLSARLLAAHEQLIDAETT
jgi:DNA-binding MarR family transcriptional regulator